MSQVQFSQFVICEIEGLEALSFKRRNHASCIGSVLNLDADKDVGFLFVGNAVVKFREIVSAHAIAEAPQTARFLGNGDGENCLPPFS